MVALSAHSTAAHAKRQNTRKKENIFINLTTHAQHLENMLQRPQCNTSEKRNANRSQHNGRVSRGHLKVMHTSGHVWC